MGDASNAVIWPESSWQTSKNVHLGVVCTAAGKGIDLELLVSNMQLLLAGDAQSAAMASLRHGELRKVSSMWAALRQYA